MTKKSFLASTILTGCSVACIVLADSKLTQKQQEDLDKCNTAMSACNAGCNGQQGNALTECQMACQRRYDECLERSGISYAKSNPATTPTPRPKPSATRPPNKSLPTPTPRKGPGQAGTSGISHAFPTPTPTRSFWSKSPTPTPKPKHS
jgi:hypothetical protein